MAYITIKKRNKIFRRLTVQPPGEHPLPSADIEGEKCPGPVLFFKSGMPFLKNRRKDLALIVNGMPAAERHPIMDGDVIIYSEYTVYYLEHKPDSGKADSTADSAPSSRETRALYSVPKPGSRGVDMLECASCHRLIPRTENLDQEGRCPDCDDQLDPFDQPSTGSSPRSSKGKRGRKVYSKGDRILQYEILETIGSGGAGVVYKARHTQLNDLRALKILDAAEEDSRETAIRLINEANAVAQLKEGQNIVRVHDARSDTSPPYIAFEYVKGPTLREILNKDRFLMIDDALDIMIGLTRAVRSAHKKNIIHGDLKPENIILDSTKKGHNRVRVSDFDAAKNPRLKVRSDSPPRGTLYYVAPEILDKTGKVSKSTDLYAMGITFYEALTGKRPFEGRTEQQLSMAILTQPARRLEKHNPLLPFDLSNIVLKLIRKDPSSRPRSASSVLNELLQVRSDIETDLNERLSEEVKQEKKTVKRKKLSRIFFSLVFLVFSAFIVKLILPDILESHLPDNLNNFFTNLNRSIASVWPIGSEEVPESEAMAGDIETGNGGDNGEGTGEEGPSNGGDNEPIVESGPTEEDIDNAILAFNNSLSGLDFISSWTKNKQDINLPENSTSYLEEIIVFLDDFINKKNPGGFLKISSNISTRSKQPIIFLSTRLITNREKGLVYVNPDNTAVFRSEESIKDFVNKTIMIFQSDLNKHLEDNLTAESHQLFPDLADWFRFRPPLREEVKLAIEHNTRTLGEDPSDSSLSKQWFMERNYDGLNSNIKIVRPSFFNENQVNIDDILEPGETSNRAFLRLVFEIDRREIKYDLSQKLIK